MKFFFLRQSQVMMEEMSFQVSLKNCQGFSIPDGRGGQYDQNLISRYDKFYITVTIYITI